MATVALTIAGVPGPPQPRRHVTIALANGLDLLTLPVTNPKVDMSDLSSDWQPVPRPGHKPLLLRHGDKLAVMRLEVTIARPAGDPGNDDVETIIAQLRGLAVVPGQPVVVAYGPSEVGQWRLTDFTLSSVRRRQGDNAITWATAQLTFTEASDAPRLQQGTVTVPPSAPPLTSPPPPQTSGQPGPARHAVQAGDSLWSVATLFYGNGNNWRRIADANSIRDPRTVRPGQVLTIP